MVFKSTYFFKVLALSLALPACMSESLVDVDYTSRTVAGYKRDETRTATITPRRLGAPGAISANANLRTNSVPVMVNNPFSYSGLPQQAGYAPSPALAAPSYPVSASPYGSLGNAESNVISTGVFMPSYNNGYQPPAYGGQIYSPVR